MTDRMDRIRKFPENMPDHYEILEEVIDIQTQKEYIDYSHSFDRGELTEAETVNLGNLLFNPKIEIDAKKKVLTLLAHLGTITAFRLIEKYHKNPDNGLKQWTALAKYECKMFLETTLTDQDSVFISSGLGGHKDKLRYFFLILSSTAKDFNTTQKTIIKEEFNLAAKDLNCIIEHIEQSDTFAGMTALVPMDVAVGIFIEKGIKKCNELGNFVFEYYYVTNQEIPVNSEIPNIIKKIKE